jgi:hypothetical protein
MWKFMVNFPSKRKGEYYAGTKGTVVNAKNAVDP